MSDNPTSTFFWKEWRDAEDLRACSWEAQAVWMYMLAWAQMPGEFYGYPMYKGEPLTAERISRLTGKPVEPIKEAIAELGREGVYSCDAHGRLYCRRMVRSSRARQSLSDAGRKGAQKRWGTSSGNKSKIRKRNSQPHRVANGEDIASAKGSLSGSRYQNDASSSPLVHESTNPYSANGQEIGSKLERALAPAERVCQVMGLSLTEDTSRFSWPNILNRALEEGLDLERHIVPGAIEAKARGVLNLKYALACARSIRDEAQRPNGRANGDDGYHAEADDPNNPPSDEMWQIRFRIIATEADKQHKHPDTIWPVEYWGDYPFTRDGAINPKTRAPKHLLEKMIDDFRKRAETAPRAH